ncbi:MAG: hypothetical protein M3004_13705 [Bacteroidota bacterium]|nr:hypothetical protein [Bacteroidota bacterium]
MKIFKPIVPLVFSLLCAINLSAQKENKNTYDPSNWFTGGSISLALGNGSFNAGLHPHYGYTIAKWVDAAAVANFEYQSQRDIYNNKYRTTVYGAGVFTRIYPVHFLFLQAQPEYNFIAQKYIPYNTSASNKKANLHAPSLLLGGGYTTSRSDKNSFSYLSILIDVVKDKNSPYIDGYGNLLPIIRAGINIGLNRRRK